MPELGKPTSPLALRVCRDNCLLSKPKYFEEAEAFAKRFGIRLCDVREYEIRNGVQGVAQKFENQRKLAGKRGIEWLFDLKGWMEVWDGKIAKRGRGRRALCMCRHKDQGPYAPWNVRIATGYENMLDWWEKKPKWCKKYGYTSGDKMQRGAYEKGIEESPKALAIAEINVNFGSFLGPKPKSKAHA